jgi:hypothetical protein
MTPVLRWKLDTALSATNGRMRVGVQVATEAERAEALAYLREHRKGKMVIPIVPAEKS